MENNTSYKDKIEKESGKKSKTATNDQPTSPWNDEDRMKAMKSKMKKFTLCIKSKDGVIVDSEKVKNIITTNGIKVNKASVNKKNNDLYVEFPTNEQREKLIPLLSEDTGIPENEVVSVKEKYPTISIRGVDNYTTEEELITRIKSQNEGIKERLDNGSHFSIVFSKEHDVKTRNGEELKEYQVVARVSEDIRAVIKASGDKIFLGFNSHRVVDRFYVKSCSRCHKFGHYRADCTSSTPCCGYCCSNEHDSFNCPLHAAKDQTNYKCTNCEENKRKSDGHSSHWHKCPTFLEIQKKMRESIPYYTKNSKRENRQ